jgi:integrase/recombinase XerD
MYSEKKRRQYCNYRIEESLIKPATVNTELRTLKSFFNTLARYEYVKENPIHGVKMLVIEKNEPRSLTDAELRRIFQAIGGDIDYTDLLQMYLHTGARRSELLPPKLSWEDIDFDAKTIRLIGKFDQVRHVPLDKLAFEIVSRRKNIEKRLKPFDFNYDYMYKKIKRFMNKANVLDGTVHALRRTFGSKLVQSGVDIYIVSKLLGHSSIRITENHYIHILNKNLQDGVAVLDRVW